MMATIKIGDLLDLSSPLVASTSPAGELLQLGGTVHHHPADYSPSSSSAAAAATTSPLSRTFSSSSFNSEAEQQQWRSDGCMPSKAAVQTRQRDQVFVVDGHVKVEREEVTAEGKCPNVVVRNGVICTAYRGQVKQESIGMPPPQPSSASLSSSVSSWEFERPNDYAITATEQQQQQQRGGGGGGQIRGRDVCEMKRQERGKIIFLKNTDACAHADKEKVVALGGD